ncbi:hypothetical protein J132_03967 [Termitomyces sp. J132]|nr:hypothetical protein J132_03967 [Termitomyces sp. J132]
MSLYKYLQEPFGPYPENVILSSHCKKRLNLKSLRMECGASPIGLDETEFIAAAPKSSRIVRGITKFYGIIELDSLEWLSPRGEDYLQRELHRRLVDLDRDRRSKGFTLNDLYRVSGIRMWIQCNKRMHTRFLSRAEPTDLCILYKSRASSTKTVNRHPSTTSRYKSTTQFVYDSDFSEVSTSSYSGSSDEDLIKDLLKTAKIYSHRPGFRSGYFEWQCPVCDYSIDLLNLKEGDTKALSSTNDQTLRGRKWKFLNDEQVQTAFFDIVQDHLAVHASLVA